MQKLHISYVKITATKILRVCYSILHEIDLGLKMIKYIRYGITNILALQRDKNELHKWASIEYPHDTEWAYNYLLEYRTTPSIKDSINV